MEELNKLSENLEAQLPQEIKLIRSFYFQELKSEGEKWKTQTENKNSAKS